MKIQIDTREKARAIKDIITDFERYNIFYIHSKMYVGDYCDLNNPLIIIDRKQNIAEIAQNATSGHARFKRELERLDQIGGKMYLLITQNRIDGRTIEVLEDVMFWKSEHGTVNGLQIYRVLAAWKAKHNIEYVFCHKKEAGKEIIRLLGGDSNG